MSAIGIHAWFPDGTDYVLMKVNLTLEMILGIETGTRASLDDHGVKATPETEETHSTKNAALKSTFTVMERTLFTVVSVATSIMVPDFSSMMAFLGAFTSFLLCVIGPISAKMALTGECKFWDIVLLCLAVIMAAWGTFAAFWSV